MNQASIRTIADDAGKSRKALSIQKYLMKLYLEKKKVGRKH